ncbi:MAG: hypothetical protein COB67_06665 [SAR324 cluster bacterium]|uniref:DUF4402 domain-containing protein n=1 Tax=SAR324 cluster bacterium TaxID=2024889 RepID=A0A2A4T5Q6_9DELT|nr:MAG: hypothetical protein COB67_06665 [SAR324 cluster bacterium]
MKTLVGKWKLFLMLALSLGTPTMLYAVEESFVASIRILSPMPVFERTPLVFPDLEVSESSRTIVVLPSDTGAASFDLVGGSDEGITASIVESEVSMTQGSTVIVVNAFTFGGCLGADGTGALSGSGKFSSCTIGGTALIPANPNFGMYTGTLTFRVVYQ